jgi:diguanylate cyclase (GGDEF)-like protein
VYCEATLGRSDMTEGSLGRDPLIGLNDRRYVLHELERHIELHKRYSRPFSVLVLSFDNLQGVKDEFGDSAGDSAIEYLSGLIKTHLRDVDIACRRAEDEYVVIMQETDKEAVRTVGERIADSVQKTRFKVDQASVTLTVSYGTASCPEDGVAAEALLRAAGGRG